MTKAMLTPRSAFALRNLSLLAALATTSGSLSADTPTARPRPTCSGCGASRPVRDGCWRQLTDIVVSPETGLVIFTGSHTVTAGGYPTQDTEHELVALDLETGQVAWSASDPSPGFWGHPYRLQLTANPERLLTQTNTNSPVARDPSSGDLLWMMPYWEGTEAREAPAKFDPESITVAHCFALDSDDHESIAQWSLFVRAIDVRTGDLAWARHVELPEFADFTSPGEGPHVGKPVKVGGLAVIFAEMTVSEGSSPSNLLVALSLSDGSVRWRLHLDDLSNDAWPWIVASPDGRSFYRVDNTNVVEPTETYLTAYDAAEGYLFWRQRVPMPETPEDRVHHFLVSPSGRCIALVAGEYPPVWVELDRPIAPIVLSGFDARTGKLLWHHQLTPAHHLSASPTLTFSEDDAVFFAIPTIWLADGAFLEQDTQVVALSPAGTERWRVDSVAKWLGAPLRCRDNGIPRIATAGGVTAVILAYEDEHKASHWGALGLDATGGAPLWRSIFPVVADEHTPKT